MIDLFSTFNPNNEIFNFYIPLNWLSILVVLIFVNQKYWLINRKIISSIHLMVEALKAELAVVLTVFINPGTQSFLISMFLFIVFSNFIGLFPYIFTASRHLSVTLSLRLPLWIGYIIIRFLNQFEINIAHLVPEGTPNSLISLIVIIESISLIIRPFTLAVRLAANMVAGHLLLVLLGSSMVSASSFFFLLTLIGLILLLLLECAVACIQRYVFIILSSLYLSEHNSLVINKM